MKMHRLQQDFSPCPPHSLGSVAHGQGPPPGKPIMIETRTKRRWIISVLQAVADPAANPASERKTARRATGRRGMAPGEKGFALRLKAATRPLAEAAR